MKKLVVASLAIVLVIVLISGSVYAAPALEKKAKPIFLKSKQFAPVMSQQEILSNLETPELDDSGHRGIGASGLREGGAAKRGGQEGKWAGGQEQNLQPPTANLQPPTANLQPAKKLIQFDHIPTEAEKAQLAGEGITLLTYIPDNAWIVSIAPGSAAKLSKHSLTYSGSLSASDKISSQLLENGPAEWSKNNDGTANISVKVFSGADASQTRAMLSNYGEVVDEPAISSTWVVKVPESNIELIAGEENVEWVNNPPPPLTIFNDGVRSIVGADAVFNSPYGLNGTGITVAEWDGGWASHTDYSNRTTIGDAGCNEFVLVGGVLTYGCLVHYHATHVAGTMLGNGSLSKAKVAGASDEQYKGVAPNATLITWEWPDDEDEIYNESNLSVSKYNAVLMQNSWGYNGLICDALGLYDELSAAFDSAINGDPAYVDAPMSMVFSSGNNRGNACDKNNGYNTSAGPGATAKNTITVGSLDKNYAVASSSSWGPTDDGRIKPEIVSIGVGVTSTYTGDAYATGSGTSMAAPSVSGAIALMYEEWNLTNSGVQFRPATIKAILTHTASDQGNAGPDYSTGFGLLNITNAIDIIINDSKSSELIVQGSVSQSQNSSYSFFAPAGNLKFTLVWDDYAGALAAAKELVNDLDLVVYAPNGSRYYPWTLNPANPSAAAVRTQIDTINPIEQVYVPDAASGVWTVTVDGSGVQQGPELFSLVSSAALNLTFAANPQSPANNYVSTTGAAIFNCSAEASIGLANISLFHNISGTWGINESAVIGGTSNWTNWTLSNIPEGAYLWGCSANDTSGNSVSSAESRNIIVNLPPSSVSGLSNQSAGYTWVYWNWTNPAETDFSHTEVWINGAFKANVTAPANYYNFTGGSIYTGYEIQTRTADAYGGVNTAWANNTSQTTADATSPSGVSLNLPANFFNTSSASVVFNCSAADDYSLGSIAVFSNISGSWQASYSSAVSGERGSIQTTITSIPDGIYEWNCIANDTFYNSATAAANRSFTADLELPNVTDTTSILLANRTDNINFTASASDSHGIQYVELNFSGTKYNMTKEGAAGNYYYDTLSTSDLATKLYNFSISAFDIVNNARTSAFRTIEIAEKVYSNITAEIPANTSTQVISTSDVKLSLTLNQSVLNSVNSVRIYTSDPNASAGPSSKLNVSRFFEISPDASVSNSLSYYVVYFYYSDSDVASTLNEGSLQAYRFSDGAWSLISTSANTEVDTANNFVKVNLTNFSMYGLFGSAKIVPPSENNPTSSSGGGGGGGSVPQKKKTAVKEEPKPEPPVDGSSAPVSAAQKTGAKVPEAVKPMQKSGKIAGFISLAFIKKWGPLAIGVMLSLIVAVSTAVLLKKSRKSAQNAPAPLQ